MKNNKQNYFGSQTLVMKINAVKKQFYQNGSVLDLFLSNLKINLNLIKMQIML